MTQTTAGIDPGATVQGGTGSLTITLPGCVEIKPGQPGTPDSSGGMGSGAIVAFAGADAPEDWLLCDGDAVSRTEYKALFDVIGEAYGGGQRQHDLSTYRTCAGASRWAWTTWVARAPMWSRRRKPIA